MARLNIDTGALGNPATGDTLRTAMNKVNTNFEEVFSLVGDGDTGLITTSVTNGDVKIQPNGTGVVEIDQLQVNNAAITPISTNANLTLSANGTGDIIVGALRVHGTTISSDNSTKISIAEAVDINGNLKVTGAQVDFTALPTSDPGIAGRLWRDGTAVKVSV